MSDNAQPITHHQALRLAESALDLLAGTFERAAVAGSLRRGKPLVGDIDLVMRPAFDDGYNLIDQRVADLLRDGTVTLARKSNGSVMANGPRRKALVFAGLMLELRVVLPGRHFGPAMTIYTGPYDANMVLVTTVGVKNRDGQAGILPRGLRFDDGGLWDGDTLLTTPEETRVFKACGLPWIPPHERSVETYQRLASGVKYEHVVALAKWEEQPDAVYGPDGRVVDVRMPAAVASGGRVEQMGLF